MIGVSIDEDFWGYEVTIVVNVNWIYFFDWWT